MTASVTAVRYFLILAVGLFATHSLAMDFVEAAPNQTKVLVDNEKVRIIRATFQAGDKVPMHSHPDIIVYIVKSGKVKFTNADGTVTESKTKAGEVLYRPAVSHSQEHPEASEAIVIELKK